MAELRRAEKLASAKKKLKQFQQKQRDSQSESGRSTPKKRFEDEEDGGRRTFQSENGGSTFSLSHSENLSSNVSGTDSPVAVLDNSMDNICQVLNGSSQPDIINASSMFNTLPKVSENLFQTSSPNSFFILPSPLNNQSGSEFFDNLSSGNGPPQEPSPSQPLVEQVSNPVMDPAGYQPTHVNASTPDGPLFQDTPNYSFPDASVSPINIKNFTSGDIAGGNEYEEKLKHTKETNLELEQQLDYHKSQILQLQTHLEDMKKKADESASSLKNHVQAIEMLVSEKTDLQNTLDKRQEEMSCKTSELEECQGRLRASRHRVTDLERELGGTRSQVANLEATVRDLNTQRAQLTQHGDSLVKRVGDLELEVSDLKSKLENRDQTLNFLKAELDEKISQLSLAEVRIQQLNGAPGSEGAKVEDFRQRNEELSKKICDLEGQLNSAKSASEESTKEYQRYVNRLHTELQDVKAVYTQVTERCQALEAREQQLISQLSEVERQLARVPQTTDDPALTALQDQLTLTVHSCHQLQTQLQQKTDEVECLRGGLQERALRIQELEVTVERLEAERPDSATLQAAIESDKVAASRAVAQNNSLKKQLEELQDALVKLSNDKVELTQQLQLEQHRSRDLAERLDTTQDSKALDVEKAQQTERPTLQETEVQTTNSQPVVSPEVMAKLEDKFRRTMGDLAELSDEKQRLEHLVMQLQGETDTIGEYIALYQIQRGMLRQRAQEKDEQVARLAQDKEALRNKLAQLNCLVQRLVGGRSHAEPETPQDVNVNKDIIEIEPVPAPAPPASIETAEQIRSLLSEIGSNNLVTSTAEAPNINFHPCPWCSGRLITV